ncbi:MAG: hypothetical protein GC160_05275 [Acidobacteria bacterium]|nr:hypothetical protein [Acidobacteriota bacterium]
MRLSTFALLAFLLGCGGSAPESSQAPQEADELSVFRSALTFHASFDDGFDAAYARGDRRVYSAPSYQELAQRSPGYWGEDIEIAYDQGKVGNALKFNVKNTKALFYSGDQNAAFSPESWSGTTSFWLSLDPAVDLEPGYCDPLQLTDSAYNDGAIWVDFTKDNPRSFRLGVFGEKDSWDPGGAGNGDSPKFLSRLVVVDQPPFAAGKWTHVAIAYDGLGTPGGKATLYLDGQAQGTAEGISDSFVWDMTQATIRLGINYVGLFDELAVFDRALTAEEIRKLAALEKGVAEIHP